MTATPLPLHLHSIPTPIALISTQIALIFHSVITHFALRLHSFSTPIKFGLHWILKVFFIYHSISTPFALHSHTIRTPFHSVFD